MPFVLKSFWNCGRARRPVDTLRMVARTMAETARAAGVKVVTGDTKVVERGACDKLFINTAGVGDLRRIPNIGEKLALKIVEFREKHGPFRRVEHLLLIDGVSDRRFREIRHIVRVE